LSTYPIGKKEKRGENETMISMGKKAKAFFFPGSHFFFLSFFPHDFHRKKNGDSSENCDRWGRIESI